MPLKTKTAELPEWAKDWLTINDELRADPPERGYVLAIDPGMANCAWAKVDFDLEVPGHERYETGKIETIPGTDPALQGEMIGRWLYTSINGRNPSVVIKEGPAFGMPLQAINMGRIHQVIDGGCIHNKIPLLVVTPSTLRSYLGSKSKSDTKVICYKRWGVEFKSEDEADAYALAHCGWEMLHGIWKTKTQLAAEKREAKRAAKAAK